MRRMLMVTCSIAVAFSRAPAQAAPSPDVFLAPLSIRDGHPVIGPAVNITNRPGYDNQPSFTPDSRAILYTSTRDDGQADIYRYDLASARITRVTSTPESEYSATVLPGGRRFSVVRVERDSTQRLWSFALDGSDAQIVIQALKPVGYYAWIDADDLALFVLGNPNALVHTSLGTGTSDTLVRRVGRSLLPLPGGHGFSYVRQSDTASVVVSAAWPGFETSDVVALPRRVRDIAWAAKDLLIVGSGSSLLAWTPRAAGWTPVADLSAYGVRGISRLAVSPDGRWIAIVGT